MIVCRVAVIKISLFVINSIITHNVFVISVLLPLYVHKLHKVNAERLERYEKTHLKTKQKSLTILDLDFIAR